MTLSPSIFQTDHPFTVGIEEEYMLCDPKTGDLINRADEIINAIEPDQKQRFSYELILSEIEANTSVCDSVDEAIKELAELRFKTQSIGQKHGCHIGISGTHPTAMCKDQVFVKNDSYQWVANQLKYYAKRNVTFATHVHIAVPDEHHAIHIANSLRQWIAPLLALSTNSPFFEGEETGLRSSRTLQFGIFPRTNIPHQFRNFSEYQEIVKNYLDIGTIEKPRQIWWKIRPHLDFGTIEFRICDSQRSLKRVEMIAAFSQALVYQSSKDFTDNYLQESFNLEYLNDALWKAARFSINTKIIDPVNNQISTLKDMIKKMADYTDSGLEHFKNKHILDEVNNIFKNGTEGDEQLKIYSKKGFPGLKTFLMNNVDFNINN